MWRFIPQKYFLTSEDKIENGKWRYKHKRTMIGLNISDLGKIIEGAKELSRGQI
ncbi:MAG: hypothetical protein IPH77_14315 [Ignavibacteria bacterium]|nr:hypothetical protein [Ignavibacteria bacterium]